MRLSPRLARVVSSLSLATLLAFAVACSPPPEPNGDTDAGSDISWEDTTDTGDTADVDGGDTFEEPDQRPVESEGPFEPGYRETVIRYQAEADRTDDERVMELSMWYPTTEEDGPNPKYYNFYDENGAIFRAEPAPMDSYPVLVFSHGNGGIAEQNFYMMERWASHGWFVVSPSHTGNTLKSGSELNIEAAVYRPQDIQAVLDHIESMPSDSPLAGKPSETIVMSGHSFGGYTTLAVAGAKYAVDDLIEMCNNDNLPQDYCDTFNTADRKELFRKGFYDERIDLAIPQTPAGARIFREGLEQLDVPTFLMTGGKDKTLPNEQQGDEIWKYMKGPEHRRLDIPRAGHFTFTEMCTILEETPDRIKEDGCGADNISVSRAHEIVNTYSLAFARHHLYGQKRARKIVDGEVYPIGEMGFELSVGAQ